MKNGYTKIFFSDPKSADLTSSKYKPSNNSEDHEEIKNVPHVFISFSCPLNATKRLETYVDFNILFADIRTVVMMLVSYRQSKLWFDPAPRQRAHHLPTGHHHRR